MPFMRSDRVVEVAARDCILEFRFKAKSSTDFVSLSTSRKCEVRFFEMSPKEEDTEAI